MTAPIESPFDFVFFSIGVAVMSIVALRPRWMIYMLNYGHPERAEGLESRVSLTRVMAGGVAVWMAVQLAIYGLSALGL